MSCLVTSHLMKIKLKKQNEVSHWLNIISMIVTIDFRLFPDGKSRNFKIVLFGNCSIGIYRMLHGNDLVPYENAFIPRGNELIPTSCWNLHKPKLPKIKTF